ncbi:hypothetical protein Taro_026519 [Colocasia esculenta]|uniref:Uncharacterized protein n=1 Tax=Colocasia esculenta TaxID=4460 RepID=A0A843VNU6_COLES|nr:hypothetical protein [Colocasia esculenta]
MLQRRAAISLSLDGGVPVARSPDRDPGWIGSILLTPATLFRRQIMAVPSCGGAWVSAASEFCLLLRRAELDLVSAGAEGVRLRRELIQVLIHALAFAHVQVESSGIELILRWSIL